MSHGWKVFPCHYSIAGGGMNCTALVAFMLSFKGYLKDPTPMLYVSKLSHLPHPPIAPAVHPLRLPPPSGSISCCLIVTRIWKHSNKITNKCAILLPAPQNPGSLGAHNKRYRFGARAELMLQTSIAQTHSRGLKFKQQVCVGKTRLTDAFALCPLLTSSDP